MNDVLRDALVAARSGNQEKARVMLAEYLRGDPDNVPAWVLLSKLAKSPIQKAAFLRKILDIDPHHAYARQALEELGQAPAPVVKSEPEPDADEGVAGEPAAQEAAPELVPQEEYAEEEETVEPLEDEWPVSDDPADYEAQAAGETIPPWMPAGETMVESEPPERAAQPAAAEPVEEDEEGDLPEWLRDEDADVTPHVVQATTDAEEAAASEKAARLSEAMAQQSPAVVESEAETERGWLLPLLIVVAAVVFLLLVYAVFNYLF